MDGASPAGIARAGDGHRLLLVQRAAVGGGRAEGVVAGDGLHQLVVIPGLFRFSRGLDLLQVHVVDHQAARAHEAILHIHVVDFHLAHFGHDLGAIGRARGLHRLQVGERGGVVTGLEEGRHGVHFLEVALGPGARLGVLVPVPRRGQVQALRSRQADAVDVGDEQQQAGELHGLGHAELVGLLDRVVGITACVG